jgi:hypothetical protein
VLMMAARIARQFQWNLMQLDCREEFQGGIVRQAALVVKDCIEIAPEQPEKVKELLEVWQAKLRNDPRLEVLVSQRLTRSSTVKLTPIGVYLPRSEQSLSNCASDENHRVTRARRVYFPLRRGSSLEMHCENSAASDAADATGICRFKRDTR